MILNQTYSATVGTFNEWGVKALLTQESFVYLEKSQNTPRVEGGREASLQIPQILNLVFGKKLSVWFLGSLQFVSIKKPICEEIAVLLGIVFLFVTQSVEINCHS